jgi:hypothetical protein
MGEDVKPMKKAGFNMSKNITFALRATVGAALLAAATLASAATTTTTIDSVANSIGGGAAKDSFVALSAGEEFSVSVPTTELWNNSFGNPAYNADADGNTFQTLTIGSFTAAIGSLVGEIGNGDFFKVGTSYSGTAATSGDLKFFYWDSDAYNNVGAVTASISAVPEPTTIALLGLGLGLVGLSRRRKI